MKSVPSPTIPSIEIQIHEFLELHRMVGIVLSVDFVTDIRPDLDEDQAWAVLQRVKAVMDSDRGPEENLVREYADELYPEGDTDRTA
ncbi:MAG: hypothetical protein AAF532_07690 [Planctomycetota bacterium]